MLRLLLIALMFSVAHMAVGTHVLGGEMYYDHLGGESYRITLKLYRDCGPGNVNNTAFDGEAQMTVFDGNGVLQFTVGALFPGEQEVPVELNSPCLQAPPTICATWAEYTTVLTLPVNSSGYVISYQRCCRTPTITNLPSGVLQGLTCTVQIPPASVGSNSSARFDEYPPIALCLGEDMVFDHSATDPDGDELMYDLFTPYSGADAFDPAPAVASPPPYSGILWAPGFSGNAPIDGAPGLMVDGVTGELTVHPTVLGSYAAAVRVREFRDGVLLSSTIRDLRFDVVACDAFIASIIAEQGPDERCTGLTIELENESINGQSWHWDMGVSGTNSDTSNLAEPTWTYTDTGTYVVTLIANPGWPCADTSVAFFDIRYPLDPFFTRPSIECVGAPLQFAAQGRFTPAAQVIWDLGEGAVGNSTVGQLVSTAYTTPGTRPVSFNVEEFGCSASFTDSATVHPRLVLDLLSDTAGCVETSFTMDAIAEAWTPVSYLWEVGQEATYTSASVNHVFMLPGRYDIRLTARTESGCVDSKTIALPDHIEVFPKPVPAFTVEPTEVSLLDPVVRITDFASLAAAWEYTIAGERIDDPSFTFEFDDAGVFDITQTVISGANCSASITRTVNVSDHLFYAPNAFTPDGDGLNDVFQPLVKGARLYELVIMDRFGTERFRTNDSKAGWDGDGLPQGVYTFQVRLSEYGPINKQYVGHITLLR
ncbi:MAG: gliding motility-associated C-terminal domain-containing protein [Flavobacteriales bacterium]|nr:gliding motility-associated C-terminal domain-containing protein [Flavobacteriales bacterium]